jgi:hypothetical protein
MPEGKAPAQFDRRIIALLLTAQVVLGGLLGLAVPVVLL